MRLLSICLIFFIPGIASSQLAPFQLKITLKGLKSDQEVLLDTDSRDSAVLKSIRVIKLDSQTFLATGKVRYPTSFSLQVKKRRVSRKFYMYKGSHRIETTFDSLYTYHKIENSPYNDEFLYKYLPAFAAFRQRESEWLKIRREISDKPDSLISTNERRKYIDGENNLQIERDSVFYKYVKTHPNSYLCLWKLSENLKFFGYKNIYQHCFQLLGKNIRYSIDGKVIQKIINEMATLTDGKRFPGALLKDTAGNTIDLVSQFGPRYTLIDFWYSDCYPCIEGFALFKQKLVNSSPERLQFITLATDMYQKRAQLIATIRKYNIPWLNLWDLNGDFAKSLRISSYPTNFLIDNEGKIVKRDISVEELLEILSR